LVGGAAAPSIITDGEEEGRGTRRSENTIVVDGHDTVEATWSCRSVWVLEANHSWVRVTSEHGIAVEDINVSTVRGIGGHVIAIAPDAKFHVVRGVVYIEGPAIPATGRVTGLADGDEHIVVGAADGEFSCEPALSLFVVDDDGVAVVVGRSGYATEEGVVIGRTCNGVTVFVVDFILYVVGLEVMVWSD